MSPFGMVNRGYFFWFQNKSRYLYIKLLKFKMMKKLFLLSVAACCAAIGAEAQLAVSSVGSPLVNLNAPDGVAFFNTASTSNNVLKNAKTTATGHREYDHLQYLIDIGLMSPDSTSFCRIWSDSTVKQSFAGGVTSTINFSSVAQITYPFDPIFNDVTNPNFLGKIKITTSDTYTVDSVKVQGFYIIGNLRPTSIVDTLIVSLGQQVRNGYYYTKTAFAPYGDLTPYLNNTGSKPDNDTFLFARPAMANTVSKTIMSGTGAPASISWKIPLTSSMRQVNGSLVLQTISSAPPSIYNITAGNVPVVSYTFKSGDTWVPNVSHVDSFHRFLPLFLGTANVMPSKGRWNTNSDHSASSLLFSTATTGSYSHPTIIEAQNTKAFDYEYLANSITLSCASCGIVTSIKESTLFSEVKAFPNPANTELSVPFTVKEKVDVIVSLTNMIGQVVATQNMSASAGQETTATFNTSSLASGVYLYTVEANGQRVSNRFSVAH
jgi:hypothetical protein